MRIPRIYISLPLETGAEIELDPRAHQHVTKVLRLRAGDTITLFNGQGGEYTATLTTSDKRSAGAHIDSFVDNNPESPLKITLIQGISRGEKMDLTIQKAVELGVSAIRPVNTERSQVKLSGERLEKRMQHWQGVLIHACEQSGRTILPRLSPVQNLDTCLTSGDLPGLRFLLDPNGRQSIRDLTGPIHSLVLLAGPEGGLGEQDQAIAGAAGFKGLRLGPRILRTETAALAAIAALQGQWGDLN